MVDNGHINNHDHVFKDLKLERKAEVDSEIIRAILDEKGLPARTGNPLVLAGTGNDFVWSTD